ncbi:MAG: hypothetical protein H7Y42_02350, partial [Chitinophagaceae bacterium]|nr:hypothetical protein [Chitinophagaceae bacterium]
MTEEHLSPQQSLRLIQSMIEKTKQDLSDNSIYYLVWGWITFIACTGQFILKNIYEYPGHYHVWWLIVIGVLFSIIKGIQEGKRRRVTTYVSESIKYLWIGMGMAYFVLSMIITRAGWDKQVFPYFILLYGLGTFISGSIIKFRPLIIGGIMAFLLAIASAYLDYDYQILCAAGAILVSYIIPAYMLRSRNKQSPDQ